MFRLEAANFSKTIRRVPSHGVSPVISCVELCLEECARFLNVNHDVPHRHFSIVLRSISGPRRLTAQRSHHVMCLTGEVI